MHLTLKQLYNSWTRFVGKMEGVQESKAKVGKTKIRRNI